MLVLLPPGFDVTRADPPCEVGRRRTASLPAAVRAELDQTLEWWDGLYRAAIAAAFETAPFEPAAHDGHDLIEVRTYTGPAQTLCAQCPPRLIPKGTSPAR